MTALAIIGGYGLTIGRFGVAILLLGGFAAWTGYFIVFEGVRGGQTPGKRIAGIRVVMDTGHAVTLGAAAVRNLLRAADFLPRPTCSARSWWRFIPGPSAWVTWSPGRWSRATGRTSRTRSAGRSSPPVRRRCPSSTTPSSASSRNSPSARVTWHRRPGPAWPPASRGACRIIRRRRGSPISPTSSTSTPASWAGGKGSLARRGAAGSGTRFAAQKRDRWDAFERLAQRASRSGLDRFGSHELPDFAARYREVAADLARARTYGADAATQARLERLVAAGHNALYREERGTWRRLWLVLARECPAAILAARGYVLLAFLVFALPAAAGYTLMRERPALAAELLPDVMLRRAEAGAERQAEGRKYVDVAAEDRPLMASGIITNNVRVAIACFAGGIFLGVGSLVLLAFNGLAIGASAGHFANVGLLGYLLEFIVGHGVLELFAIWVSGAAGFLLGRTVVAPGPLTRGDALVLSGRLAIRMLGGAALMLLVAGMIEGFVSASSGGLPVRFAASGASLAFLALYLYGGAQSSRSMARMRMASASISRRLETVSASMRDSLSSSN